MKTLNRWIAPSFLTGAILITTLTLACACGSDDPYNTTRSVDDNAANSEFEDWPAPGPAGGGSGTTNNSSGDDPLTNKSIKINDLEPLQVDVLCENTYKKFANHDDPILPEGHGACLDFAVRRAYEHTFDEFDIQTQFLICEEEYLDCLKFPVQQDPTESCMNSQAQTTCEATVDEFDRCTTAEAKALTHYFLQLNNHTCADYILDDGITALDILLDQYPQPQECISLLNKCPDLFD